MASKKGFKKFFTNNTSSIYLSNKFHFSSGLIRREIRIYNLNENGSIIRTLVVFCGLRCIFHLIGNTTFWWHIFIKVIFGCTISVIWGYVSIFLEGYH